MKLSPATKTHNEQFLRRGDGQVVFDPLTERYFAFSMARYEHPSDDFKRKRYLTYTHAPSLGHGWADFKSTFHVAAN